MSKSNNQLIRDLELQLASLSDEELDEIEFLAWSELQTRGHGEELSDLGDDSCIDDFGGRLIDDGSL